MTANLPERPQKPVPTDVVKEIARDIGKAVAAHVEIMYPAAVTATSSNMLISIRGCVYNEIMAALDLTDEDAIRARLETRKAWRRKHKAAWKRIRDMPVVGKGKVTG